MSIGGVLVFILLSYRCIMLFILNLNHGKKKKKAATSTDGRNNVTRSGSGPAPLDLLYTVQSHITP